MKKIKKMKEKDFEMEQDLFAISKANRRGMIIFLAVMLALWCVPIYSLLKDSLKVHGLENYWYVLTNEVNGVPFYQYFINSIINAVFASALAEMLISSEKGKITILPALPDSWKNGKVRGLLAAGAIEVDITWKDRKPVSVSLRSSSDQNVSLFYRNRKLAEQIELKKQEQQIINLCSC